MEQSLGIVTLKSGIRAAVALIECPVPEAAEQLSRFYSHKPEVWLWHIEQSLLAPLDDLETRFYLARVDGEIAGCIVTTEYRRMAVVTHVFTEPKWRGNGICTVLLREVLSSFRERRGQIMSLGTDYGGQAYRLYYQNGFRSVAKGSGTMFFEAEPEAINQVFRDQDCVAVTATLRHWPGMCALVATGPGGARSKNWSANPHEWFECDYLTLVESVRAGDTAAKVLESEPGIPLGMACLYPRWRGARERVLEVWTHPSVWGRAHLLLESLGPMPPNTRCYAEDNSEQLYLLRSFGFREVTRLDRAWGNTEGTLVILAN